MKILAIGPYQVLILFLAVPVVVLLFAYPRVFVPGKIQNRIRVQQP
jgi:hypothetical protein